jgi:hypothetical protein
MTPFSSKEPLLQKKEASLQEETVPDLKQKDISSFFMFFLWILWCVVIALIFTEHPSKQEEARSRLGFVLMTIWVVLEDSDGVRLSYFWTSLRHRPLEWMKSVADVTYTQLLVFIIKQRVYLWVVSHLAPYFT